MRRGAGTCSPRRLRYRCPVGELGDLLEVMHPARNRLVTEVTELAFDEELDDAVLAFVPPGTAPDPPEPQGV